MSSEYMSTVDAGGMGEVHWEDKFDSATSLQSPTPVASSKQLINLSTLKNTCNNQQSFNLSASKNGERKKKKNLLLPKWAKSSDSDFKAEYFLAFFLIAWVDGIWNIIMKRLFAVCSVAYTSSFWDTFHPRNKPKTTLKLNVTQHRSPDPFDDYLYIQSGRYCKGKEHKQRRVGCIFISILSQTIVSYFLHCCVIISKRWHQIPGQNFHAHSEVNSVDGFYSTPVIHTLPTKNKSNQQVDRRRAPRLRSTNRVIAWLGGLVQVIHSVTLPFHIWIIVAPCQDQTVSAEQRTPIQPDRS